MYKDFCNPCIIQTIIICCTIVVLGHIGICAYRIKKQEKVKERSWASYIYGASILLTLSIVIFSYFFHKEVNVLDFISLSSAIISIILAIVTIIYSYYINSESRGQIENLNKAAADVSKASQLYSDSSQKLDENVQKIIDSVTRVAENTDKLVKDLLTDNSNDCCNEKNELDTEKGTFKYNSSKIGKILLYGLIMSKDNSKALELTAVFNQIETVYCMGFYIATKSANLINGTAKFTNQNKEIKLDFYKPELKTSIINWINSKDDGLVRTKKELIDKYFEE